jgi:hypothetical protein
MKLNIGKTRDVTFTRKKFLFNIYTNPATFIILTEAIKALGVIIDSEYLLINVLIIVFQIKLLGFLQSTAYRIFTPDCLLLLYFTLIRSKIE